MGNKQAIFKEDYCNTLRLNLKSGQSILHYAQDGEHFAFTDKDVCYLNDFYVDKEKLAKMNEDNNSSLTSAILLYEALPDLNPLLASYAPFWLYVAHVELVTYMRNRWPNVFINREGVENSIDSQINYIMDYWFPSMGSSSKTWLPNLWWAVYLTVDTRREDKYALTKILFKQEDLRTRTLGTYTLFRHKPATVATLSFIESHMDTTFKHAFQNKCRYMTKYLNYLGGCRLLSYMDEDFFTHMLELKNDDISKVI
ncbi:MAG: hypothetical protein II865_10725 [Bacteroidales bacterium]|jgi:hypothetical protein|nr:hypothetical protein [Bacteroidales bacterium]